MGKIYERNLYSKISILFSNETGKGGRSCRLEINMGRQVVAESDNVCMVGEQRADSDMGQNPAKRFLWTLKMQLMKKRS